MSINNAAGGSISTGSTRSFELILSVSHLDGIDIWDLITGQHHRNLPITGICGTIPPILIDDYSLLSIQTDKSIITVHNYRSGQCRMKSVLPLIDRPQSFGLSHSQQYLAIGTINGKLLLYSMINGLLLLSIENVHYKSIKNILFMHNDTVLCTSGEDAIIHCYLLSTLLANHSNNTANNNINNGNSTTSSSIQPFRTFTDHSLSITGLITSSPCNPLSLLYSSSIDRTVRIYNIHNNELIQSIILPTAIQTIIVDNCNNTLFAGGQDGNIYCININSNNNSNNDSTSAYTILTGHSNTINCLTLNYDNTILISCSNDGTIKQWNINSSSCIKTMRKSNSSNTNNSNNNSKSINQIYCITQSAASIATGSLNNKNNNLAYYNTPLPALRRPISLNPAEILLTPLPVNRANNSNNKRQKLINNNNNNTIINESTVLTTSAAVTGGSIDSNNNSTTVGNNDLKSELAESKRLNSAMYKFIVESILEQQK